MSKIKLKSIFESSKKCRNNFGSESSYLYEKLKIKTVVNNRVKSNEISNKTLTKIKMH